MNNLQIIRKYSTAVWETKNVKLIDNFFSDNAMIHSPIGTTQGTAKLKMIIQQWHVGFPHLKVHWDDFICEGNKVVSRWHAEGVQEGAFLGYPASNKKVCYSGVSIYSLENGKINEYWAFVDMQSIKNQVAPSYYAVIFTSVLNPDNQEGYEAMAEKMFALAESQSGFLGIDTARDKMGISVSYWKSLKDIAAWKSQLDHLEAQALGKKHWYQSYNVRICKIEKEYDFDN